MTTTTIRDALFTKVAEMPHSLDKINTVAQALKKDIEENANNSDVAFALAQRYADWCELGHVIRAIQPDLNGLGFTKEEDAYIRDNQRIQAIKLVRARLGLSLKESKEMVDHAADRMGIVTSNTQF